MSRHEHVLWHVQPYSPMFDLIECTGMYRDLERRLHYTCGRTEVNEPSFPVAAFHIQTQPIARVCKRASPASPLDEFSLRFWRLQSLNTSVFILVSTPTHLQLPALRAARDQNPGRLG